MANSKQILISTLSNNDTIIAILKFKPKFLQTPNLFFQQTSSSYMLNSMLGT